MRRRNRIFLAIVLPLGMLHAATVSIAKGEDRPNILYLMSDDHAVTAIGAYGGRLAQLDPTPTLDKLAAEGMVMENTFCNNSVCSPSRASILTGQYSHINGVRSLGTAANRKPFVFRTRWLQIRSTQKRNPAANATGDTQKGQTQNYETQKTC